VVNFTHWPLYPEGRVHGTHWIGGWVDLRAGLDDLEKNFDDMEEEYNAMIMDIYNETTIFTLPLSS
jgi:hypothetical protein